MCAPMAEITKVVDKRGC